GWLHTNYFNPRNRLGQVSRVGGGYHRNKVYFRACFKTFPEAKDESLYVKICRIFLRFLPLLLP
ncbi:MAG: hypothetical protein AB1801_22880, partial [Chloroflexota bacterium]